MNDKFDEIWAATLGSTLDITKEEAVTSNGLDDKTASMFEGFHNKSDKEVLAALTKD